MKNPLISVIVPVYNVEKYLDKCIESIVNQTYKNLEIILVDDGSPDNCPKMCDAWAEKDSRIKVLHKENGGLSDARNAGIEYSNGEYVCFIDSDDWIDRDMIESLLNSAIKHNVDVVSCGFYYEYLDRETVIIKSNAQVLTDDIVKMYILDKIRPEVCSKLYSKKCIGGLRFDVSNRYAEDVPFNYYVMKNAETYASTGTEKYHYLQNSGNSLTTAFITDARANSYKVFEKILLDNKENPELYPAALWRFTVAVLAILSRVMRDRQIADKYYYEIVNAVLKYKKSIFRNSLISTRHKLIVLGLSVSPKLMIKLFKR